MQQNLVTSIEINTDDNIPWVVIWGFDWDVKDDSKKRTLLFSMGIQFASRLGIDATKLASRKKSCMASIFCTGLTNVSCDFLISYISHRIPFFMFIE